MICPLCRNGSTRPGFTTLTLERAGRIVLFREVPAEICDNCEEPYVDDAVAAEVLQRAEDALARGAELEVVRFAA